MKMAVTTRREERGLVTLSLKEAVEADPGLSKCAVFLSLKPSAFLPGVSSVSFLEKLHCSMSFLVSGSLNETPCSFGVSLSCFDAFSRAVLLGSLSFKSSFPSSISETHINLESIAVSTNPGSIIPPLGHTQYRRGAVVFALKPTFLSDGFCNLRFVVTSSVKGSLNLRAVGGSRTRLCSTSPWTQNRCH